MITSSARARHVQHQEGRAALRDVDDLGKRLCVKIIDPVQRRRRGQEREVLGALRKKTVKIDLIDALGRENGLGNALRRILVEIDVGGSEGQIKIGDDHLRFKQRRNRPPDIVGDGR